MFANCSRVIGTFFAAIAMIYLTVTSLRKSMTAPYAGQTTFEWRLVASPVRHIGSHRNPRACGNGRISANGGRLTTTRTKKTNYFLVNIGIFSMKRNARCILETQAPHAYVRGTSNIALGCSNQLMVRRILRRLRFKFAPRAFILSLRKAI